MERKNKEYNFKVPTGTNMLPLSRERSLNARLKNLMNWEKESVKRISSKVEEGKEQ